jgi:rhomboid family GlyGly-CTERM serine protease
MRTSSLLRRAVRRIGSGAATALIGAALILALQAAGTGPALEYRRELVAAQPWRLLSAHWVHLGWWHALLNGAAWLAIAGLYRRELGAPRQVVVILGSSALISAAFALFEPELAWYRGLSGVLHALFCAGAVLWIAAPAPAAMGRNETQLLPWALLAGAWIKVLAEPAAKLRFSDEAWLGAPIVTRAHLYGAAAGTMLGWLLARAGPARPRPAPPGPQDEGP